MRSCTLLSFFAVAFLLAGCGKSMLTAFTDDPSLAKYALKGRYCEPDAAGKFDLEVVTIEKKGNDGQHDFADGGGCIGRGLREAWAVTHNKETLHWTDTDITNFQSVVDPRVNFLLKVAYLAGPGPFAQSWLVEWYHTLKDGTLKDPRRVLIRYKKTIGTSYIPFSEGDIELVAVSPTVTSFVMHNAITAAQTGPEEAAGAVRDMLLRTRAQAPNWDLLGRR